jgi:hypothetical protein
MAVHATIALPVSVACTPRPAKAWSTLAASAGRSARMTSLPASVLSAVIDALLSSLVTKSARSTGSSSVRY